ncbi:hypothetical protein HKCCSP123_03290 [Rhodobacterales bacterium HKCCSP123]|nr:hypothetical protein [Rhodobacterales bacterium HKCCSP123]
MSMRNRDTVTVSPPTFDRTAFADTDAALPAPHAPYDRDWLMARFAEGLQIRMLKPPHEGFVMFQPGRLAWRPIEGAERAVVIHDLRVGPGALARESASRLWTVAGNFARYYGYSAVLALLGKGVGLISPGMAPGRGWLTFDEGPCGERLVGQVMHGPLSLPSFPADWTRRAAALGKGLVIQTTGESVRLERVARTTAEALSARGVPVRLDRLVDPDDVHARALCPGSAYTVAGAGRVIGGAELGPEDLLRAVLWRPGLRQRPS